MKILNILRLGFVFAGCFLGAGYVSGQELWQFFGIYQKSGFWSMLFSCMLFLFFGFLVMSLSKDTKITQMDEIVVPYNSRILKAATGAVQVFFIIGIYVIMCAGAGALLNQLFGIHIIIGSGIFCIFVTLIALKGIGGVVDIFSFFVPPLITGAVLLGFYTIFKQGFSFFGEAYFSRSSAIISNPIVSAILFVSYNFFASIGILAPVSQRYKTKKEIYWGVFLGCVFLFAISFFILCAMNCKKESITNKLPMLYIASDIHAALGIIYAVLLLGAMLGTSISSLVAVCEYAKEKYSFSLKKASVLTVAVSTLACVLSLIGFDKLIGIIYPVCGVFGFFALVLIIIHYIRVCFKR